jgi:zinc/manganese transport system permease protein
LLVAYVATGAVHVILRKRFIELSWHPDRAEASTSRVALWDFFFYALFGITITLSVQIAGVLLVFSYLIAPALITKMFGEAFLPRLIAGWVLAGVASLLGLWGSWTWDVPTGAAVVVAFGVLLAVAAALRAGGLKRSGRSPERSTLA